MKYQNILIAVNPFKENLGTLQAGKSLQTGILTIAPGVRTTVIPVSDGGDGLLEVMTFLYSCEKKIFETVNALGEPVEVAVLFSDDNRRAFIEMAASNGLKQCSRVDFSSTSSYGVGLVIKQAIENGAREILMGVGGSASTDMGLGLMQALGLAVFDKNGEPLQVTTGNLGEIGRIDVDSFKSAPLLSGVSIECLVDGNAYVDGDDGCWQRTESKGGDAHDRERLKESVTRLIPVLEQLTGKKIAGQDLMGCGGASAAGLYALANAKLALGSEVILNLLNMDQLVSESDLVITGEGIVDHTTFLNKLPGKLLQVCKDHNKPAVFVTSRSTLTYNELQERGVFAVMRTELDNYDVQFIKSHGMGEELMQDCGRNLAQLIS